MNVLTNRFAAVREYLQAERNWKNARTAPRRLPSMITGLCEGALDAFLAAFVSRNGAETVSLIVAPDEKTAHHITDSLNGNGVNALFFPARDPVFYSIVSSHDAEFERIFALSEILSGKGAVLVATPDAVLEYTMPKELLSAGMLTLSLGDTVDLGGLAGLLVRFGYTRTDLVDGHGTFSVRGGIADIFPPQSKLPIRLELFGDEIDQIGFFDILTQRKTENINSFTIAPAREILMDGEARGRVIRELDALIKKQANAEIKNSLLHERETVGAGMELYSAEKFLPVIYEHPQTLLDYVPEDCACFLIEHSALSDRMKGVMWHNEETAKQLLGQGLISPRCCRFGENIEALFSFAEKSGGFLINSFLSQYPGRLAELYSMNTRTSAVSSGNIETLTEDLESFIAARYEILIAVSNEAEAGHLHEMLEERNVRSQLVLNPADVETLIAGEPIITVMPGTGFELTASHFLFLVPGEGHASATRRKKHRETTAKKSSKEKILSYADLTVGDYVVHETHGIGRYMGLETIRDYQGVYHDHIKIQYAGTDVLYVRCEQIETVSKYIGAGADDGNMRLSKLGGVEWGRTKSRVKSEVRQMAKELIALYAERLRRPGFAFFPDDAMQEEFESAFEFEETEAQLIAADEIKRDMEKPVPMDRLLCGDVGFGKTEVALRAAFKAVASGKQVAILVPTTILAMQHYQTILQRMRGFPVRVSLLSRFRSAAEQDVTVRALRRGDTDIVVGTHRLLSADIAFRNLGLVIIDEEQRFGVAHKEKLKQLSKNVDVLTMTATPIPRTLNMAMNSIRDMSVLDEAPGDRLPVQTYVLEYDSVVICEAIRRELSRGGQVFYLYNRIESISGVAGKLKKQFPDATVEVAHGQMDKDELADIWQGLVAHEIDILVCTTIIETGVDVPNANTLIIENADTMGLSQLHQLRGRVGRSARRAYAYFTYRPGKALTEISTKRLAAIRDYTEFGSGFKIALRDLEIRGAGDVLGANQHGHMESVGYDMYLKILNEAVLEERGEVPPPKTECTVSIGRDSYIPDSYIPSASQRIDMYKKIASIETEADMDDVADELLDRYGDLPNSVETLLCASLIRAKGSALGFTQIDQRDRTVLFYPKTLNFIVWSGVAAAFPARIVISPTERPFVTGKLAKNEAAFDFARKVLSSYEEAQKEVGRA